MEPGDATPFDAFPKISLNPPFVKGDFPGPHLNPLSNSPPWEG
jgi:hypothetical protein